MRNMLDDKLFNNNNNNNNNKYFKYLSLFIVLINYLIIFLFSIWLLSYIPEENLKSSGDAFTC